MISKTTKKKELTFTKIHIPIIYLFLLNILLILIPSALADTFTNLIIVKTFNGTINITTEESSYIYDGMSNTTNSITFNLKRNVTSSSELANSLNNFTGNINSMVLLCDKITQQYGDINSYFKLYAQCNLDYGICQKEKSDKDAKITELTPFKPNYETCDVNLKEAKSNINKFSNEVLPVLQQNISYLSNEVEVQKCKKIFWCIGGVLIVGIIIAVKNKKFNPKSQLQSMGSGR